MIGHSNRVNHMLASDRSNFIFSSANDCTVRKWDVLTGVCDYVFKFADPISVIRMKEDWNYKFTANWDKMVRASSPNGTSTESREVRGRPCGWVGGAAP